ncbi:hypothetical protein [Cohnella sp. AR92]|uniref:hypothetical protein n=1 Tax=Cohnella sp. AR92 TaxID=648716 RepID=UPI000F8E8051|nr:hypothetical protein [Cohnella sp. AR92]RUS45178.1 hypothetical protein ELR57_19870 [Cohnella sp. AR92]
MTDKEANQRIKLSQWDALQVESLRGLGWSNEEIIERIERGAELPKDESVFQFNYEDLAAFAKQEPGLFRAAVREGYQIKYNTVRGIRSWIWVAFGYEPQLVLDEGQEAVLAELTPAQLERLRDVLSYGWRIVPEAEGGASGPYRIEPIQR